MARNGEQAHAVMPELCSEAKIARPGPAEARPPKRGDCRLRGFRRYDTLTASPHGALVLLLIKTATPARGHHIQDSTHAMFSFQLAR